MAIWLDSAAEPSTTLDISLHGLGSISEDSHTRAPPASPEGSTGDFDHYDFEDTHKPPKRSPTYPFIPPSPSKPNFFNPLEKAKSIHQKHQKRGRVPPIPKNKYNTDPMLPGIHGLRHASTIYSNNSASFEATAVWDHKAILSLDGGGIRGFSALLILQELMKVIGRIEGKYACGSSEADGPAESSYHPLTPLPPAQCTATIVESRNKTDGNPAETESSPWLPCHYFDYVAGTSTGGLIGIMLGRLRMNVDDCISEYETLGQQVFGHSRKCHIRSPLFWPRDKYNYKALESVVREVVRRRVPKVAEFPGGRNFAFDENRCRTVVVAFQQQSKVGAEQPYLFRTYKNLHKSKDREERNLDRNPDMAHDIPIWQVARATSAAPTYFKPAIIDGLEYVDGGFGANNPCVEIYEEVRKMNNKSKTCVSIILSIGTGKNNKDRRMKGTGIHRYLNYLNFARKWASDSEETHLDMLRAKEGGHFDYFRLNVERGLDLMKLDEWRTRGPIRIKIGKCIGNIRSSLPKNQLRGIETARADATDGEGAIVLKEKDEILQNGNSTIHTKRNGFVGHTSQQAIKEPGEQVTDRRYAHTTESTSTAHSEDLVDGSTTKAFDQQEGHHLISGISAQRPDPNADNTKIPSWFQPKNWTLESMRDCTRKYLDDPNTKEMIEQCAKLLVDGRRGRAKSDPQRWERACFGTWYQCRVPECPRGEKEYEKRWELRKHLLDKHKTEFSKGAEGKSKLEEALDRCKIVIR